MKPPLLNTLTPFPKLIFIILLIISAYALTFLLGLLLLQPLFGLSVTTVMGSLTDYENRQMVRVLEFFQVLQSVGLFVLPPILAGYLFGCGPVSYLNFNAPAKPSVLLLTIILLIVSLPMVQWMISLNEMIRLPEFLRSVELWMQQTEEEAAKLTEAFMKMDSAGSFLFNLLMIAVIPALGEEMMFRGLLQRLFREWLGNVHVAIFISAFLFSAMHFQFYGFIPRLMLGLGFGYLYFWSGSIWVPVLAHFVNNGAAVLAAWLASLGILGGDWESFGSTNNIWMIFMSFVFTAATLFFLYRLRTRKISERSVSDRIGATE